MLHDILFERGHAVMFLSRYLIALVAVFTMGSLLTACGPVKFSSSSSGEVKEQNTPPDDDDNNGGGDTDGGGKTTLRDVSYTNQIEPKNYKLDIVLIIDDSNSMLPDNQKLASKLSNLVTKLQSSSIDWQMCATVTRALPIDATTTAWGASIYWQNSDTPSTSLGMVLKRGTPNLSTIFAKTINYINAGWVGSDDERGIKAAYRHAYNGDYHYNPNNGCYRNDSAVTYIIISDEDVRSIGGDASQQVYAGELKTLEEEDKPDVFVSYFKSIFGASRRFTVNSIIVKPGDTACKGSQDATGAKSHYGFKYKELSELTGGGVGSICADDFSANMDLFFAKITDSLTSVPLECAPYNGNIAVTIVPAMGTVQSRIEGTNLVFDTPVSEGHTITLKYKCVETRSPSSIGQPGVIEEVGIFTRVINFFKSLFL